MSLHNIQIELEGLIKLLAQNLYANPDVFLREMIQNAHDAIRKRIALAEERGETQLPAPEIRIETDPEARALIISDNGAGLTEQEIHDYIATIGRSGTGELKSLLQAKDKAAAIELIGQFGIGLLSAFIVADSVELTTRSALGGGYRWVSTGSKEYSLENIERARIGTTVTLRLGREHTRYLDAEHLRKIVRTYANIIGVPVYLNRETYPANEVDAPWHRSYVTPADAEDTYYAYWEKRFRDERALDVWPLQAGFTYKDEKTGEEREGEIRGVLGITDRRVPGITARGTVDVFVARMFIATSHSEVLPAWARFIQGVVECGQLTPNAARDDVVRNAILDAVRQTLGDAILSHLTHLYQNDRKRFTEIMRWHSYQILAMCALEEHRQFFQEVADMVPLKSDQGFITIPQYLEKSAAAGGGNNVYYITEPGSISQYYLLCEARGIRVFDATESYAEDFLERYAKSWPGRVRLNRLDVAGSDDIFEPVLEPELGFFRRIETELRKIPNLVPKISRFKPKEVPALLTQTSDAESRGELEGLAEHIAIPGFIRDKIKKLLSDNTAPMTLHINADNPIIARLARRPNLTDEIGWNAIISLYNNAVMLHSRNITPTNIRSMFEQYNKVIDSLLSQAERREELESLCNDLTAQLAERGAEAAGTPLTKCVTCFVAMPFGRPGADRLYRALEAVLEDAPFFWNLIRADEQVKDARLWKSVEQHMSRAHCFIAEVTEHNPNVMIEIGRMEVFKRPLLLLKQKDSQPLPADIRERLYAEYDPEDASLAESLREQILRQEQFCEQEGEQYLSEAVLKRLGGLNDGVCRHIAKEYETCRDFLDADPAQAALKLGVNPFLVQAAQDDLVHLLAKQV